MNAKQVAWSILCVLVYIGIPAIGWLVLNPETFWQRFVIIALTSLYALIAFFGIGFVWFWVTAEVLDD